MEKISAGDLRSRVTVMRRVPGKNALGEDTYDYEPDRKVWARIVPTTGRRESLEGDVERAELRTDLRLRYRGQDYEVRYFYPNYRDGGFVDLFVRLVVEDGVQRF